jgi:sulfatase modifying factor 1
MLLTALMLSVTMAKAPADMATIPAGTHQRLYGTERVSIERFALDREEVTRADFLAFVRANPEWRKSTVARQKPTRGYLADWKNDLDAGTALQIPVTSVSWYAADAYCKAQGKRLPSVDEWEFAAAASQPALFKRLIGIYAERAVNSRKAVSTGIRNIYGVRGLHDRAWEWTSDFKPEADPHRDHAPMKGHVHTMSCASSATGAANPNDYPAFMRYAVRAGLERRSTMSTLGFRCAATLT